MSRGHGPPAVFVCDHAYERESLCWEGAEEDAVAIIGAEAAVPQAQARFRAAERVPSLDQLRSVRLGLGAHPAPHRAGLTPLLAQRGELSAGTVADLRHRSRPRALRRRPSSRRICPAVGPRADHRDERSPLGEASAPPGASSTLHRLRIDDHRLRCVVMVSESAPLASRRWGGGERGRGFASASPARTAGTR